MKKLLLIISVVCFLQTKAQYVTILDTHFAAYLDSLVPAAMNGNQMDTTSPALTTITTLSIMSRSINDITGVQYFKSLRYLYCGNNYDTTNLNAITFLPPYPIHSFI